MGLGGGSDRSRKLLCEHTGMVPALEWFPENKSEPYEFTLE